MPWFTPKYEKVVLRSLAYGEMQADAYSAGGSDDDDDDGEDQERSAALFPIILAYEDVAGSDLLSAENVAKMVSVEKAILAVDWAERCVLRYKDDEMATADARCAAPISLLNYLHEDDEQHREGCEQGFCLAPYAFCLGLLGVPAPPFGTFPCRSTVFDWTKAELAPEDKWDELLEKNLCSPGFETKFLLDRQSEDCDGETDIAPKYARARYSLGFPLKGYKATDDRPGEQRAQLEGGIFGSGEYGPKLLASLSEAIDQVSATRVSDARFSNRTVDGRSINVFFSEGVTGREVDTQFQAVFLSAAALVFVWAYIWFNVGSLFLAITGTFEIIASLPLAWFVWRIVLWQLRLDIFAFSLIIFLILCIGADDIFVRRAGTPARATPAAQLNPCLCLPSAVAPLRRSSWTRGRRAAPSRATSRARSRRACSGRTTRRHRPCSRRPRPPCSRSS